MAFDQANDPFTTLRAVLFDLDGTLVETHIDFPAMTRATQELIHSAGVPPSVVEGKDILGMVDAAVDYLQSHGGDADVLRRRAFAQLEEMEVAGCAHPTLLPGTRELMDELQSQGRKVGIVTRNCRRVSVGLVERYGLPHDVLLTRDDVARAKPNPEHLWDALRVLEMQADVAVMVGDHWMDVQAGQAAGCPVTIGVRGGHGDDWFAPCPPTRLVTDLRDALPLFRTAARV
jgi:phosphoglycolate phosphatase